MAVITKMPQETELSTLLREAKRMGFSDHQLAHMWQVSEEKVRMLREAWGIEPVYKTVDTCAAEFEAYTPYHYSTYEEESEVRPSEREKVIILGGGPNRIGQGIEFDYCCCHAVFALRQAGYETVMVNSNPETVSTDYDTADRLYFEPLTLEDVLHVIRAERPLGVIVQFGGQTPLKLAVPLEREGVRILGTSPDSIDMAEDRKRFAALIDDLGVKQPPHGATRSYDEAKEIAERLGYPVLVRPSFVLGGRAMVIVYDANSLEKYIVQAADASPDHPILIDKYLENAIEVDVDAVADGRDVYVAGVMEHIEYAGIHSGDSACVLPPRTLKPETVDEICRQTTLLALRLQVKGLINIQYAVTRHTGREEIYILEVNPRASRTVPYVSKATGVPLAKIAAMVMVDKPLNEFGLGQRFSVAHFAVKEAVLPFVKFPDVDPLLGPEMRSTGEVMGIDAAFGEAYAKSQMAAGMTLPMPSQRGRKTQVIISVRDCDKPCILPIASALHTMGFEIVATGGTSAFLETNGVPSLRTYKVYEGRPNVVDVMKDGHVGLLINTPSDEYSTYDEKALRRCAVESSIPYITTVAAAQAAVHGIRSCLEGSLSVKALQDYYRPLEGPGLCIGSRNDRKTSANRENSGE